MQNYGKVIHIRSREWRQREFVTEGIISYKTKLGADIAIEGIKSYEG